MSFAAWVREQVNERAGAHARADADMGAHQSR